MQIHYAFQTCDIANREQNTRFCGNDRTLLSKKSLKSLLNAVKYCSVHYSDISHIITILSDRSTCNLIQFIEKCIQEYSSKNIHIEIVHLPIPGILNSIRACYTCLQDTGEDFVYQVQDDYLFTETAIYEMLKLQMQMKIEINEYVILSPYNDPYHWLTLYRNRVVPRAVICSKYRYWIQYFDMSCSFLLHYKEFSKHWDIYDEFFRILRNLDNTTSSDLENKSLNYILTQRNVLGLIPINSLAFHMQTELEKDPYIDWKPLWDQQLVD